MSMTKNKSNSENQKYWKFVEETSKQVSKWPQWLRGTSQQECVRKQDADFKKEAKKPK
jgi:hypothetical protein